MAQKKGIPKQGAAVSKGGTKNRGPKQPTQKTPQKRIAIMGPTGKIRFEWVEW